MIKLGDAYFDEASIMAIAPEAVYGSDAPATRYLVYVAGGKFYPWNANAEEVQRRLEEVGLIEPEEPSVPLDFQPNELELLADALDQGYYYAARDSTGQVYAYRDRPSKGKGTWLAVGSESIPLRLRGEFAALSWDDEESLDIAVALEGVL